MAVVDVLDSPEVVADEESSVFDESLEFEVEDPVLEEVLVDAVFDAEDEFLVDADDDDEFLSGSSPEASEEPNSVSSSVILTVSESKLFELL